MDRFSETISFSSGRVDRDEDGRPDMPYSAAGHICDNCNEVVERLTWVEGFEYWGCDECRMEAEAVIARETAEEPELVELEDQNVAETIAVLAKAGCTRSEVAVWMQAIENKMGGVA